MDRDDEAISPEITSLDSQKISRTIIQSVQQHPVLYISDVKGTNIKLPEFRPKVWKRIADDLGLDPTWVKLRWKNLRDTYSRIVKGKSKSDPGVKRKKWVYEDDFKFLKFPFEPDYYPMELELSQEYISDINTEVIEDTKEDSRNPSDTEEQEGEEGRINFNEYLELIENNHTNNFQKSPKGLAKHKLLIETNSQVMPFEDDPEEMSFEDNFLVTLNDKSDIKFKPLIDDEVQQIQAKYRKIVPKLTVEKTSILDEIAESQNSKSRAPSPPKTTLKSHSDDYKLNVDQYFRKMAEIVGKLPPKAQEDVKMEICKIVNEAEILHAQEVLDYNELPGSVPQVLLVPYYMLNESANN